jgi:thymidylate kinase
MTSPKFVVVDGLTGSGKSTILRAIKQWATECGHKIFDLEDWSKTHTAPPSFEEVNDFDVYFTFEPSKTWIGSAIRHEMSRTDDPYSGLELAHAFSLDRLIQYRRLILPALSAGKTVIQDRSVSTSIIYQPAMAGGPTLEELLALPGNAAALQHVPDALILTHVKPETAAARLQARANESKGVFEDLELLRKIAKRFAADWFSQLYHERGTSVHHFNADVSKEQMEADAKKLIEQILSSC